MDDPVFTGVVLCMIYWEENGGKMRIGVDIDGVLNYRQEFMRAYGAKFCFEKGLLGLMDITEHSVRKMFGVTQEERDEFWWRYGKYQM